MKREAASRASLVVGVMTMGLLLAIIAGGAFIIRSISRPVANLEKDLEAIVESLDLTTGVEIRTKDEIGRLGKCCNQLIGKVDEAISEIVLVSTDVAAASTEIIR